MAATVPVEKKGDPNLLLQQAQQIGEGVFGGNNDEAPSASDADNGSFERFMSSFGSPQRWAGHN